MVLGYDEIYLDNQKLYLRNLNKIKVNGTVKQKLGSRLVKRNIPDKDKRDWQIRGAGIIYDVSGTAATTARNLLESKDDLSVHNYSDGLVTASVIIEKLNFSDEGTRPLHYEYEIRLIEK